MRRRRLSATGVAILVFLLLLGVLVSIRLTGLGSMFSNPVGHVIQRVLSPVEGGILSLGNALKNNTRALWEFRKVEQENEELKKQVEQLTGDNLQLKEKVLLALRYNELNEQFRNPSLDRLEKIGASIINRSPTSWYQTLTVNRGSKDGIKVDHPVYTGLGLVGKVISVTQSTADILLITDGEGKVGAQVRNNKGEAIFGIVQGTYKRGSRLDVEGHLQMNFKRDDEVNEGDMVFTSGYGGVYPKGIPVGRVEMVQLDKTGLLKTAYIEPLVNFDSLEEVYIVINTGE